MKKIIGLLFVLLQLSSFSQNDSVKVERVGEIMHLNIDGKITHWVANDIIATPAGSTLVVLSYRQNQRQITKPLLAAKFTIPLTPGNAFDLCDSININVLHYPVNSSININTGVIPGQLTATKFGFNGTVPNGSFADIWSYGPVDDTYNWLISASVLRIKAGGHANDTIGGSGARTIVVHYLDSLWVRQKDTLQCRGSLVSDSTSVKAIRINRAYVLDVGSYGVANSDTIIIETAVGGIVVAAIDAQIGQTQQTMYTVPAGSTGHIVGFTIQVSTGTNKDADIVMWQRGNDDFSAPHFSKRIVHHWMGLVGSYVDDLSSWIEVPDKTDIWFIGQGNGAETSIDIRYGLVLIAN